MIVYRKTLTGGHVDIFTSLLIAGIVLWLSGFAGAMMMGQQKRYVSYSKRTAKWFGSHLTNFVRWMWKNYHTNIIWFIIGVTITLLSISRPH